MGTRNLVAVMVDGQYKVAQYGQWDGYPSVQGKTILNFLGTWNREEFTKKVRALTYLTDDDIRAINAEIRVFNMGHKWKERWPELSRDTGAEVLEIIAKAPSGLKLRNDINFAWNTVLCEWAYVIDLDKSTLEVYAGFNNEPLTPEDRFFGGDPADEASGDFAAKLIVKFSLDNLPTLERMKLDCGDETEIDE